MRARPRLRRLAAGLSLVELLVAVGLGGLLTAGVIRVFLSNRDAYEYNTAMIAMQDGARFALNAMLDDVRHAGHFGCSDGLGLLRNSTQATGADYEARFGQLDYMGKWRDSDAAASGSPDYNLNARWIGSAIEGFDGNAGTTLHTAWLPSEFSTTFTEGGRSRTPLAATDGITVRFMRPAPGYRRVLEADGNSVTIGVDTTGNPTRGVIRQRVMERGFVPGAVAAVSNCQSAHLFTIRRVQNIDRNNGTATLRARNDITSGTFNPYGPRPGESSTLGRYVAVRYFVSDGRIDPAAGRGSTQRIPTLYRQRLGAGAEIYNEPMLEGVEDMQVLYGLDDAGDGEPDRYVTAAELNTGGAAAAYENWLNVLSVRISLLVRSSNKVSAPTTQSAETFKTLAHFREPAAKSPTAVSFACPSGNIPEDHACRFRRRVFTGTAAVRNL